MKSKKFQDIHRLMQKHVPTHTIKFTDIQIENALAKRLEEEISNKIKNRLKETDDGTKS